MTFRQDDRAVSELIGFILLFGFLIILMSIWQAQVVPAENAEVEYNHYLAVDEDLSELRSDYIDAAESGTTRSTSIKLGTTYPTRIFFVNGPPPRGRIFTETSHSGTISGSGFNVSNVCGLNAPVKTRPITFNTDYQYFSDSEAPPYRFENTVLYRQAPDGTVFFESEQILIQDSTINLYPLTSNVSRSGVGSTTIDYTGAKTGKTEVTGNISLTIPTALSDGQWTELLDDEPNFQEAKQVAPQRVKIELSNARWNVQCTAIGAGQTPEVDVPQPDPVTGNTTGAFSIGWQDPTGKEGTQPPCNAEECVWNVSSDSNRLLNLTASTTPSITGMTTHFAVDNTSVATLTSPDEKTNQNGDTTTRLNATANGTVAVYVATGATSDVINITVTGVSQDDTSEPATQPYNDANENGVYDRGETTYNKSDLYDFNQPNVNLVIPAAVGDLNRDAGVSITANRITSEVDIVATYGSVSLTATGGGVQTSNVIQSNNNVEIRGTTVDISGGEVHSNYGEITISATESGGGQLTATGALIETDATTTLESEGDMVLDGATLQTSYGQITADLGGPNTLHISGTQVSGTTAIEYTPSGVTEDPERSIAQPQ